ncbi:hypothetical protein PBV52_45260 [Streptomyces sp. T12]|uniref:hypothetical protein n=1 Tax=Streptomyces sp. T12 TaxID=477697 RepID=UPI002365573B|nr:hypothetical protein [Streptomyces sp. T12]WDF43486.1 hypothetical protein PBV52_45260 [Streptomyces sp. T12]
MLSIVSLCTSIAVFYWQRRHGVFDLARLLHADLTGGEVAKARDMLGTLVHSPGSIRDDTLPEVRTAYFTLLWCFDRLYAGRRAIQNGGTASRRPLRFLDRLIGSQVAYWAENLPRVREELARHLGPIEDEQSLWAFEELKRTVLLA